MRATYLRLMTLAFLTCCTAPAFATATDPTMAELKALVQQMAGQISALQARVDQLESADKVVFESLDDHEAVAKTTQELQAGGWDRIQFKGDFRYRFDAQRDAAQSETQWRERERIRARAELAAGITDKLGVGFGMISGDEDPLSGNQTLGENNTSKDWRLDKAYFSWDFSETLHAAGGKISNPVVRPANYFLIWDNDLRPEGLSLDYSRNGWFGNLSYNIIESDDQAGEQDVARNWIFQGGRRMRIGADQMLMVGGGYYDLNTRGKGNFDSPRGALGNSIDENGKFRFDYDEVELFAEYRFGLGNVPALVFFDYVVNLDADSNDTGYAVGARVGNSDRPGGFSFAYTWQELEADAVYAFFTDSDFAGGGTDNRGHAFSAGYGVYKNTEFSLTYYTSEYGENSFGEFVDYQRLFVDLAFKF